MSRAEQMRKSRADEEDAALRSWCILASAHEWKRGGYSQDGHGEKLGEVVRDDETRVHARA